jgi:hypothetical protein
MMGLFDGQEGTITSPYLRDLLDQAGWKLIAVHHDKPSAVRFQKAICPSEPKVLILMSFPEVCIPCTPLDSV